MIGDLPPQSDHIIAFSAGEAKLDEDLLRRKAPLLLSRQLEPRVVFPAAAAGSAIEVGDFNAFKTEPSREIDSSLDFLTGSAALTGNLGSVAVPAGHAKAVVFIDPAVVDITAIVKAASMDAEIVLLDETADGLEQISAHLHGRSGIEAMHLVSHGEPGMLRLGCTALTRETILGEHAHKLTTIRAALSDQANLIVHGCDAAAGTAGGALVAALGIPIDTPGVVPDKAAACG